MESIGSLQVTTGWKKLLYLGLRTLAMSRGFIVMLAVLNAILQPPDSALDSHDKS